MCFSCYRQTMRQAPGFPHTHKTLASYHAALSKVLPKKAVLPFLTIGAEQSCGLRIITSLHLMEQKLGDLPIAHAFLRAGWFMENHVWDEDSLSAVQHGQRGKSFSNLYPLDRKFSLVATADIGKAGADVLGQEWKGTRYIEIAGPGQYSPNDLALAFSSALGRKIEAQVAVPREKWTEFFLEQGMPGEPGPESRAEMVDGFNSGWIHVSVCAGNGTHHGCHQPNVGDCKARGKRELRGISVRSFIAGGNVPTSERTRR